MWKHAHTKEAYAVYLDPTKGGAKNPETGLDPPDAVFSTKKAAEEWIELERYKLYNNHPRILSPNDCYILAIIFTIRNCWLPVWAVIRVNDKSNKPETTEPVGNPNPIPDFLIESTVKGITKGLQ